MLSNWELMPRWFIIIFQYFDQKQHAPFRGSVCVCVCAIKRLAAVLVKPLFHHCFYKKNIFYASRYFFLLVSETIYRHQNGLAEPKKKKRCCYCCWIKRMNKTKISLSLNFFFSLSPLSLFLPLFSNVMKWTYWINACAICLYFVVNRHSLLVAKCHRRYD